MDRLRNGPVFLKKPSEKLPDFGCMKMKEKGKGADMGTVLIIGGGAAGMFAAAAAAKNGQDVHVYEKNERLGKKLYITGKGRCNLTNACAPEDFFSAVRTNEKFLYSSFYGCTNEDAVQFFERYGCHTKVERGQRVFPVSDKSADVIDALRRAMAEAGVKVHLNVKVEEILHEPLALEEKAEEKRQDAPSKKRRKNVQRKYRVTGIRLADGKVVHGDAVIIATGGISYPSTGSTGDGYRFAKSCGHKVEECFPSLVPFNVREPFVKELQGLSLRNVSLGVYDGKACLYEGFGEMMFTHFGITGPLALTASAYAAKKLRKQELSLVIDLKPALSQEQLDARLLREFEDGKNRQFKNVIGNLFPAKLTPVIVSLSKIRPEKKVNEITHDEREFLASFIKHLQLTATGLRDYNEAVVTKGGVSVREVDPSTMESKLAGGLYFAGEVLDLDAVTGGFNLQIAWSTGYAAGRAADQAAQKGRDK